MSRKQNILLIFILLLHIIGFSQNSVSESEFIKLKEKFSITLEEMENIKLQNDTIILRNTQLENKLKNAITSAKTSVSKLEESKIFFDRINIYFTIIAAILGVFTILSPIIIFTTGILPARKEIKVLKKTVHDFIINRERESIDFAIDQLFADTDKERYEAAFLLSNRIDFKYSTEDVKKIIKAYKIILDNQTKFLILNILCNQATLEVDKFFRDIVKNKEINNNIYHTLRYLSVSKSDFTSEFLIAFEKTKNPFVIFSAMIIHSINISFSLTLEFANNKMLIKFLGDKIELNEFQRIKEQILSSIKVHNPKSIPSFKTSELVKKIDELKEIKKMNTLQEERKKESERKKENEREKEKKVLTDIELIKKYQLKQINGNYFDKNGNNYPIKEIVPTMYGLREVKKMIYVEGKYIDTSKMSEYNDEG